MVDEKFRLSIELVPSTSWYINLRGCMRKSEWDKLRKRIYSEYDHKCGICAAHGGRLSCHEIWEYNEDNHTQRLAGFIALCNSCHFVKHFGFASILAAKGEIDLEKIIGHFMEVNGCDRETFEAYQEWVFDRWRKRSRQNWELDMGEYANLVESQLPTA